MSQVVAGVVRGFKAEPVRGLVSVLNVARVLMLGAWMWYFTTAGAHAGHAHAYWQANFPDPYTTGVNEEDAYLYSPAFLHALLPMKWLPWDGFYGVFTGLNVAVLTWMVGPVVAVLTLLPSPPTEETDAMVRRPLLPTPNMSERLRLVLLAFLVLFVELALIRWTGSNIVYLSFFTNFVLLGSFLGIGLGFLRAKSPVNLFPYAPVVLAFLVGFVLIFPVKIDRSGSDLIFFGEFTTTGLPTWITLPVIFVAVATALAFLAEGMARQFVKFPPLEAYRLDIMGSILGIVGFTALSFVGAPPVVWGLVVAGLFAVLLPPTFRLLHAVALVGLVFMLGRESFAPGFDWSPYYRVGHVPMASGAVGVEVNGIPHQNIWPLELLKEVEPSYGLSYARAAAQPDRVLIIGAGTGNDVALALDQGVEHVDAVEIDPQLQRLGERLHPDQPYADPRVEVHINDGRAFLEQTRETYDLILFALPDSLTLVSGQSAIRLESYLFTIEAIQAARERLGPNGVFSMYNFYREDWLIDRLAGTLETAFGHPPCLDSFGNVGRQAVLTVGMTTRDTACRTTWSPSRAVPAPSRDDHPFVYLREPSIPTVYLVTALLILAVSALAIRGVSGTLRPMLRYVDLFFMGAAFLLLEAKSVVQFALLFGTTWFVNSVVFTGVLLSVYLAIEVTQRVRLPKAWMLYAVLLASVLVALVVPLDALLELPLAARFLAAVLLWFTPIFIANLVFAQRFRNVEESNVAFGANLLGAVAGGVVEYAALVTGYSALAIVVAMIYGAAFIAGRRHLTHRALAPLEEPARP